MSNHQQQQAKTPRRSWWPFRRQEEEKSNEENPYLEEFGPFWAPLLLQMQQDDPTLKEFSAHFTWGDTKLPMVARAMKGNTHLQAFGVNIPTSMATTRVLAKAIRESHIQHLALYRFAKRPWHTRVMVTFYLEAIKPSHTIQELTLFIDFGDAKAFQQMLPQLRKLTLRIVPSECYDGWRESFRTSSLEELHIRKMYPFAESDTRIFSGSIPNASLKRLTLKGCIITPGFMDKWPRDSQLKELTLEYGLDADQALALLRATANHPPLETLNLNCNRNIGYSGLQSIAELLATNTLTLKHLVLSRIFATDDDDKGDAVSQFILRFMPTNTHLHTLDLSHNNLRIQDGDQGKFDQTLQFYLARNRFASSFFRSEQAVPPGMWSHVMSHYGSNPSCIFYLLQQQPTLLTH